MKVKELIEELKKIYEDMEVKLVKKDNIGEFLGKVYSVKENKGVIELN